MLRTQNPLKSKRPRRRGSGKEQFTVIHFFGVFGLSYCLIVFILTLFFGFCWEHKTRTEPVEGFTVFKNSKSAERQPNDEDNSVLESVQQKKEKNRQLEVLSFFLFFEENT